MTPALDPVVGGTLRGALALLFVGAALHKLRDRAAFRAALAGYVPDAVLDRVRWREGASELSLPQSVINFGDVPAMTLVDVVVFQDRRVALEDPKLWAHELFHVMQFAEWGIEDFARRYISDYQAVEDPAWEFRWEFMKKAGLLPEVPSPAP